MRLVRTLLEHAKPRKRGRYVDLIELVKDYPGHDRRYAMDTPKIESELGWRPQESFESDLAKTVRWYRCNAAWVCEVTNGEYHNWVRMHYGRS